MKILLGLLILIGGGLLYRMIPMGNGRELEGRWTIVSPPEGWKKVPGMDLMVTSDEIQIRAGTMVTSKMRYTIDPSARKIDAFLADEAPRLGVYRLDDDSLTLSVGEPGKPRPDNPDSTSDGAMRWELRRGAQL